MKKVKNTISEVIVITLVVALAFSGGRFVLISLGVWS